MAIQDHVQPGSMTTVHMMYFVIGASGSGKTSAVRELERTRRSGVKIFFFDSIGVPAEHERTERWGSGDGWQRAMTIEWVKRIRGELINSKALLDGQTRPSFIAEACEINDVGSYKVILIDCTDDVRRARLLQRGQPELANERMMQWARYLIGETKKIGGEIIHNHDLSTAGTAAALARLIGDCESVR